MSNVNVLNINISRCCFVFCLIIELSTRDTLFILLLIRCVIGCAIGLKMYKFCAFDNEIIIFNDGFKLKCELECRYFFNILLSIAIDAATTPIPTINFDLFSIGSCQTSRSRCDSFDVSLLTIAIAIPIENQKQTEYERSTYTNMQHNVDLEYDRPLKFDSFGAEIM